MADAVLALCEPRVVELLVSKGAALTPDLIEAVKDSQRASIAAQVMTVRADRTKRH